MELGVVNNGSISGNHHMHSFEKNILLSKNLIGNWFSVIDSFESMRNFKYFFPHNNF